MQRRAFFQTILQAMMLGGCAGRILPAFAQPFTKALPKIVVIGGGWAGLSVLQTLRKQAPEIPVTLVDQSPRFWSHPLSNRWLVGLAGSVTLSWDYAALAATHGFQFVQASVQGVDRQQRVVITETARIPYDFLVVAAGISENFDHFLSEGGPLDPAAVQQVRQHFSSGFESTGGAGIHHLKTRLGNFKQGHLLMTIPPMPYRCPTAPYERAGMLAWWIRQQGLKARLLVLDANTPPPSFSRVVRETYADTITYFPQSRIRALDPFNKEIQTDFETLDFDEAILMAPQAAGTLLRTTGLTGQDHWGNQEALSFRAKDDERIYLLGDGVGRVSPLFGFYPKTGEMAVRQGQIVAANLMAQARGIFDELPVRLPSSSCLSIQRVDPLEISRFDTHYRLRPDGVIQQTARQTQLPQAHQEDIQWAQSLFGELGLPATPV